jgi:hypothetical protein
MGLENLMIILKVLSVEEIVNTGRLELSSMFTILETFYNYRKEMHDLLFKNVLTFETFSLK